MPEVKIIAPWREWDLNSRTKLLDYARKHGIDVPASKLNEPPYSMDANLLHISYEGKVLEDPWAQYDESMLIRTTPAEKAPDKATFIEIEFEKGDAVAVDGERLSPAKILAKLNKLGGENGIGVIDIVENRYVGMKSRGVYETPGGTILLEAHRAIESITLDREVAHLKDDLMPRYAMLVYSGYWFSPERIAIQALVDESQKLVNGTVKLKLYKGNVDAVGRKSNSSLYHMDLVTFEEDNIYNQRDAEGFIKLNGLRLKLASKRNKF
jgi:argininosuccinate synthase